MNHYFTHSSRGSGGPTVMFAIGALVAALTPSTTSADICSDEALKKILSPAVRADFGARVECDLDLSPDQAAQITRQLIYEGPSAVGLTLDCNGGTIDGSTLNHLLGRQIATIDIRSLRTGSSHIEGVSIWQPPSKTTIRDCTIKGSIHIRGMAQNGEGEELMRSSREPGHVERARAAAPRGVTLEAVTIEGRGRIPLYIAPGVQDTLITHSYLTGHSESVALYLDAESTHTVLRDSEIDTDTSGRELVAVDSSDYNRIISTRFARLEDGGIYLYRNCGDEGTIRITTPSHNEIINNIFYYNIYTGPNPSVFLGSRNGGRSYCSDDAGYSYGSSKDDRDFARHNVVMQNQIYKRPVTDMIRNDWPAINSPNYVKHNTTVKGAVSRPAGCYLYYDMYRADFITDGEAADVFVDANGLPYCLGIEIACDDGNTFIRWAPDCSMVHVQFSCSVSEDNDGCASTVNCPAETQLIGAQAACNLEFGDIEEGVLETVPGDVVRVVRASDYPTHGLCWVGSSSVQVGEVGIAGTLNASSSGFGCVEHDANGGDCEIIGVAFCYSGAE